jgi:hypothetical protein
LLDIPTRTFSPGSQLGHESAATTLNHHAGLLPTDLDDVAMRLDAAAREAIGEQ